MVKQLLSRNWLPAALRRDYPLTRFYLRRPPPSHVKHIIFGSSLGLFLLFGGLGLPMLYFLFSLVVLLQLTLGTAQKIHQSRSNGTTDLVSLTLLPRRDILLSTWASGVWQLRQTWLMPLYRVTHGVLLIGGMVFTLVFTDITPEKGLMIVVGITLLIALQPYADMYFSGMVGVFSATYIRDRLASFALAWVLALTYWVLWIGGALLVAFSDLKNLTNGQIILIFVLPLLFPTTIGYIAQILAERTTF